MSNVEKFPLTARRPTEYEALVAAGPSVLDAIPNAIYICNDAGWLIHYNSEALKMWGRTPASGENRERFSGAHRMYRLDGTQIAPEDCPMAEAVRSGIETRNAQVIIERPDNTRCVALVNARVLRDHSGNVQGAITCLQDISTQKEVDDELIYKRQDLEDFFENGAVGLHIVSREGIILRTNQAELDLLGYSKEEYVGRHVAEFHADAQVIGDILHRLSNGGKLERCPARLVAKNGSIKHVLITSNSRFTDGQFVSTRCFTTDVTDLYEAEKALRDSERHMRILLDALPAAVYTTDAAGRITFYNKAAVEMAGRTPASGDEWCVTWRLYTPDGTLLPHDQCPMAIALREDRPIRGVEAIAERPDGSRVPFMPYPTPLHDGDGRLIGAINMLVDITDHKRAENRQKILIDELNHRVKNTLATVQSLALHTARHAESLDDFVGKFQARLLAVARAHDLLTQRHWENAPLNSLATEVLAPLAAAAPGRVTIEGPSFDLSPRAALSLTMALSELATNAAKYGALSSEEGTLSLIWELHEGQDGLSTLDLEWLERDGPTVQSPTRRGFGTRLMKRCIETDLCGVLDLAYEVDGVHCRLAIPVANCAAHV